MTRFFDKILDLFILFQYFFSSNPSERKTRSLGFVKIFGSGYDEKQRTAKKLFLIKNYAKNEKNFFVM